MELTGKIIAVLAERGGVSTRTGNAWKSQEYVIETVGEQYPRRCVFNVFGEDKIKEMNIQVGDLLTVYFDIDARVWNERWFNDIRAWKVVKNNTTNSENVMEANVTNPLTSQPTINPTTTLSNPSLGEGSADDLPF